MQYATYIGIQNLKFDRVFGKKPKTLIHLTPIFQKLGNSTCTVKFTKADLAFCQNVLRVKTNMKQQTTNIEQ